MIIKDNLNKYIYFGFYNIASPLTSVVLKGEINKMFIKYKSFIVQELQGYEVFGPFVGHNVQMVAK